MKLPALPTAAQYRAWRNLVYQSINTASGRPDDKALAWAREVEDETKELEYFDEVPRRFKLLSRKLATALQKIATGELGRRITQKAEDYMKEGRSVPGLVLLRVVQMDYSTNHQAEVLFNLLDLQKVQIKGGNIEGFLNSWDMVLKGMKKGT